MQEKIRTNSRIPTKQVEKMVCVSIQYAKATRQGPTPAQMRQKLESIESLATEQSQHHDSINHKPIVLKYQHTALPTSTKPYPGRQPHLARKRVSLSTIKTTR